MPLMADLYKIRRSTERDYTNPAELQTRITDTMRRHGNMTLRVFVSMMVVFIVGVAIAVLGWPIAALFVIAYMGIATCLLLFQLIPSRPPFCPKCHSRMIIDWIHQPDGRDARFAVCNGCRLFIDTHWGSR